MKRLIPLIIFILLTNSAYAGAIEDTFAIIFIGINFFIIVLAVGAGVNDNFKMALGLGAVGFLMLMVNAAIFA